MALTTLNALPDPQSQLRSLQTALRDKTEECEQLREDWRREHVERLKLEIGVKELRTTLHPLFDALQLVFGVIDDMKVAEAEAGVEAAPQAPAKSAVWDSWKKQVGGKAAEAIDVLLLHGEMNAKQLRLHLHCGSDYIYNVISKLWTAGLINKNHGKISLRQL